MMFGVFIGVLWLLPFNLVLHGAYNFLTIALLINSSWAVVEQGLGGIVIGLSYKYSYTNKANAQSKGATV